MSIEQKNNVDDMIDKAIAARMTSQEDIFEAARGMAEAKDQMASQETYWKKKRKELPPFVFPDVSKENAEAYQKALEEAYFALVGDQYGCVDYKDHILYYDDTPHVSSFNLRTKEVSYSYEASLHCDDICLVYTCKYDSEEERQEFIRHENAATTENWSKQVGEMLDMIDSGNFRKLKRKLYTSDFKDYSRDNRIDDQEWKGEDLGRTLHAVTFDAFRKVKGKKLTEEGIKEISDAIRLVVQYSRSVTAQGLMVLDEILFHWKPSDPVTNFINRSSQNFLNGIELLSFPDNMAIAYYKDAPQGWTAVAYALAFEGLLRLATGEKTDEIQEALLSLTNSYSRGRFPREELEKLLKQDAEKQKEEDGND